MPKYPEIKKILDKYVQDECTPEELDILINYFRESKNTSEVPSVEEVNLVLKDPPKMESNTAEKIYNLIISSPIKSNASGKKKKKRRRKIWQYSSIAAMIIGIILGGYYTNKPDSYAPYSTPNLINNNNVTTLEIGDNKVHIMDPSQDKPVLDAHGNIIGRQFKNSLVYDTGTEQNEVKYNTLKVPYGKKFNLILSDGTIVYLNAGTSLKYPIKFPSNGSRQVILSGEAFFEVTENKEKPFIVTADEGMKVKVLGTRFNIKSYPEDGNVETTLIDGKVRIMENNSSKEVDLKPSEKAIYHKNKDAVTVKGVDTSQFTSWKEGVLIYDETPLYQVIKDLERTYDIAFEVESETIRNYKFNGVFDNLTVDQILEIFELSSPIKYYKLNKKIILKEAKS